MEDVECPYCGEWQEICHDDGYGYAEDRIHWQECGDCDKSFAYTTIISFDYTTSKAECLNGADHKYEPTFSIPRKYTMMQCGDCGRKRNPTEIEMVDIMRPAQ